jgi:ABC-type nitrate/sulfonate/bicarbonate transport system substrate-binding protein
MKKVIILAVLGLLLTIFVSPPAVAQDLKTVKVVIPRGTVFPLNYFGGKDAGIFRKHGIDIQIDARPFPAYLASLPGKETFVTSYAGLAGVARINQGMDLVVVGGGLTVMQDVFVLKDSPLKSMSDLRGNRFGIWSTGAGAAKSLRACVFDAFGFDLFKDAKVVEAPPPALVGLADKGEVDAFFNVSSMTIRAFSQPDKYRSIFSPNEYWKQKTGFPVMWSAPLVAWREWVQQDPERAKNFVTAIHESFTWLRQNPDVAIGKYGKLGGVKTPAEANTYKKWLKEKRILLVRWNPQVADTQWKFLELAKKVGVIKKVPSKEKHALFLR